MTGPRTVDVLEELRGELAVEPSEKFAAGVRALVEAAGRPSSWLYSRQIAMLAASVVVLIGLSSYLLTRPSTSGEPATRPTAKVAPISLGESSRPIVETRRLPRSSVERRTGPTQSTTREELVVITNQPALLRRLWTDVAVVAQRIDDPTKASNSSDSTEISQPESRIAITPIVVKPIVVERIGGNDEREQEPPAARGVGVDVGRSTK